MKFKLQFSKVLFFIDNLWFKLKYQQLEILSTLCSLISQAFGTSIGHKLDIMTSWRKLSYQTRQFEMSIVQRVSPRGQFHDLGIKYAALYRWASLCQLGLTLIHGMSTLWPNMSTRLSSIPNTWLYTYASPWNHASLTPHGRNAFEFNQGFLNLTLQSYWYFGHDPSTACQQSQ